MLLYFTQQCAFFGCLEKRLVVLPSCDDVGIHIAAGIPAHFVHLGPAVEMPAWLIKRFESLYDGDITLSEYLGTSYPLAIS